MLCWLNATLQPSAAHRGWGRSTCHYQCETVLPQDGHPAFPAASGAVLMMLGSIEWEAGAFTRAQEVLQQSAEFCSDHPTWRLNLAHTILAQEGKLQVGA